MTDHYMRLEEVKGKPERMKVMFNGEKVASLRKYQGEWLLYNLSKGVCAGENAVGFIFDKLQYLNKKGK